MTEAITVGRGPLQLKRREIGRERERERGRERERESEKDSDTVINIDDKSWWPHRGLLGLDPRKAV